MHLPRSHDTIRHTVSMKQEMRSRIASILERMNFSRRFMLASLVILVCGMVGIGVWVAQKIQEGVVDRTGATATLYVDSVIAPLLQELAQTDALKPENVDGLNQLLNGTPLGKQLVIFKVWDTQGKVLYSTDQSEVGQVFPVEEGLAKAVGGNVAAEITNLQQKVENIPEQQAGLELLEIYSPVRLRGTDRVIGVMEFYQSVADLKIALAQAQRESWLVVGAVGILMYLLLALFVRRASDTIEHQQTELSDQMVQLRQMHERVRRAAARTTALNEQFLRRISAELHDGPVQELALALFRVDDLTAESPSEQPANCEHEQTLPLIAGYLRDALNEIRAISTGLGVPELNQLSLEETLRRAVRAHERRTKTQVAVEVGALPANVPLSIKITVYRVLQEALNNASRHAAGASQHVRLVTDGAELRLQVSDKGPGFSGKLQNGEEAHLGLIGMRERVESLGGWFRVESESGDGTQIDARLPLQLSDVEM